jgi:Reverse transcriptase (RNA-dependent DNA polymerase)
MLFSLTNTSAIYQTLINDIFRKFFDEFVIVYLDDILIFLKNKANYIRYMTRVFKILKKFDIKVNGEKCIFHFKEVEFLKYIFILRGIRIDPKKIIVIAE